MRLAMHGKGMLSSVEQVFVGRDEKRAPLKTPAWEAKSILTNALYSLVSLSFKYAHRCISAGYSRCEHNTSLCQYPDTSSRAPSVDSPLVSEKLTCI